MTDRSSDYKDDGTNILLDANENAYGPSLALNGDGQVQSKRHNESTNGKTIAKGQEIDLLGLNRYPDP